MHSPNMPDRHNIRMFNNPFFKTVDGATGFVIAWNAGVRVTATVLCLVFSGGTLHDTLDVM